MDFSYNDVLEHVDLNNMLLSAKGWGVLTGLAVSERGAGANMSVDVALGECYVDETIYTESGTTNVVITAADATHARKDLIIYDTATSAPIAIAGSPAATPQPPDITASDILLALVDVAANDTSISDSEITSKSISIFERPTRIEASDVLLFSNDTERTTTLLNTYVKLKETRIPAKITTYSEYRIKFDLAIATGGATAEAKIYLNDVDHGTEQQETSTSYVTYSEDLIVSGGDLIQVWGNTSQTGNACKVQNFRLYGDEIISVDYASTAGY